jgi:GntR family transcriptional regulator/MocR family aminotransferase
MLPAVRISLERDTAGAGLPVYRQIAERIRDAIADERLDPGTRLPPIRSLARDLGVNRDTVAMAYEELAAAGLIESTVGRGTFVRGPASEAGSAAGPWLPALSAETERLLEFERARPRFATSGDAVPMHALLPDPALYPAEAFRRVLNRVLAEGGADLLLYGAPGGHPGLRALLAERLRAAGIGVGPDELVLCHGASQGITLALRLFTAPGDAIALEEPTYTNALAAALGLGLRPVAVPMREAGPDLGALERALARPDVKLFYTMPTFHNPMGTTTSLAHRQALLEIAARHGKPVIEDGYEMDLRFEGRSVPPLAGLDDSGRVVHLFSFSKSLFPGARVGAVTARGRVVDGLLALKQATDLSDAIPLQAALAEFTSSGAYDRHLVRLRRELRARRDAVLEALDSEMPAGTSWTRPEGGYQIWVELAEGIDTGDLLVDAVGAGVLFAPGSLFHLDGRASRHLRLSIATAGPRALRAGVTALARVVEQRLRAAPRAAERVHV